MKGSQSFSIVENCSLKTRRQQVSVISVTFYKEQGDLI